MHTTICSLCLQPVHDEKTRGKRLKSKRGSDNVHNEARTQKDENKQTELKRRVNSPTLAANDKKSSGAALQAPTVQLLVYWDNMLCFIRTKHSYVLDITPQKIKKKHDLHDTKRGRPRHVQKTACRHADLSSFSLQDSSKPGLNRASRRLRLHGQHI